MPINVGWNNLYIPKRQVAAFTMDVIIIHDGIKVSPR